VPKNLDQGTTDNGFDSTALLLLSTEVSIEVSEVEVDKRDFSQHKY